MAVWYNEQTLKNIDDTFLDVHERFGVLRERYLVRVYKSLRAKEFAYNGFSRRLGTLIHCIDQVFEALPPTLQAIPKRDTVLSATTAIQSFVLNAFGCLDNLAWIWVEERPVLDKNGDPLNPLRVGLGKKNAEVRASFSPEFNGYLDSRQDWIDHHLKGFRDSLAHRIPLYIPPFFVDPKNADEYNRLEADSAAALAAHNPDGYDALQDEQEKLGFYRPWMTHSITEKAPIAVRAPHAAAGLSDDRRVRS